MKIARGPGLNIFFPFLFSLILMAPSLTQAAWKQWQWFLPEVFFLCFLLGFGCSGFYLCLLCLLSLSERV